MGHVPTVGPSPRVVFILMAALAGIRGLGASRLSPVPNHGVPMPCRGLFVVFLVYR